MLGGNLPFGLAVKRMPLSHGYVALRASVPAVEQAASRGLRAATPSFGIALRRLGFVFGFVIAAKLDDCHIHVAVSDGLVHKLLLDVDERVESVVGNVGTVHVSVFGNGREIESSKETLLKAKSIGPFTSPSASATRLTPAVSSILLHPAVACCGLMVLNIISRPFGVSWRDS